MIGSRYVGSLFSFHTQIGLMIYVTPVYRLSTIHLNKMACRVRIHGKKRSSARLDLGEQLYAWRKRNDLSQSEAGVKLQVSVRTLQEWEQGRARPHGLTLRTLHQLTRS